MSVCGGRTHGRRPRAHDAQQNEQCPAASHARRPARLGLSLSSLQHLQRPLRLALAVPPGAPPVPATTAQQRAGAGGPRAGLGPHDKGLEGDWEPDVELSDGDDGQREQAGGAGGVGGEQLAWERAARQGLASFAASGLPLSSGLSKVGRGLQGGTAEEGAAKGATEEAEAWKGQYVARPERWTALRREDVVRPGGCTLGGFR